MSALHPSGARPRPPRAFAARDGAHLRLVLAAAEVHDQATRAVAEAEDSLRQAVRTAVSAGDSWTVIGGALGMSRQAAQKRFGKGWTPPPRPPAPKPFDSLRAGPVDPVKALRRQREAFAALRENPVEWERVFGDGLDEELDDGFDGYRSELADDGDLRPDEALPPPGRPAPGTAPG